VAVWIFIVVSIVAIPIIQLVVVIECNKIHDYEIIYDENFIIGNDYKTIVDEYGEFDVTYGEFGKGNARGGYFVKFDTIDIGDRFYFIEFNSELIATKTYIGQRPGG
jgi:hypothetical protein